MITKPHNDRQCLDAITATAKARVESGDPELVALAEQLGDADEVVRYIQSLPQRDDDGLPCDGPKVAACRPAQRLRLPADDPNCVERAALYITLAELLDPGPVRRLATVNTENGLHTFPTEDGAPVILDPAQSRNALRAGLFRIGRNSIGPLRHQPRYRRQKLEARLAGMREDLARVRAAKAAGQTTWEDRPIDDAIATHEKRVAVAVGVLAEIPRDAAIKDPDRTSDPATRRLRIERLIGTDETKGVRGDLGRVRKAKAAGYTTWIDGRPIDDVIAGYEKSLANYQRMVDELPRNAAAGRPLVALTPTQAIDFVAELASEPAARFAAGPRRVRNGHRAMRTALVGRPLCVAEIGDVAFLLALAEREARRWGDPGVRIVRTCAYALDRLDHTAARQWLDERAPRNRAELSIGRYKIRPNTPLLAALGRVGARLGGNVATQALRVKLASMGIGAPVLGSLERELNREGLSLGPLAAPPPMLGSLSSLTPEAVAGRWLASKI